MVKEGEPWRKLGRESIHFLFLATERSESGEKIRMAFAVSRNQKEMAAFLRERAASL